MSIIPFGNTRSSGDKNLAQLISERVPRSVQLSDLLETFPQGQRKGEVFTVGSFNGEPGKSLKIDIAMHSPHFMQGSDFASGEGVGGICKVLMEGRGWTFQEVVSHYRSYIGDVAPPRVAPPQNPIRPPETVSSSPPTASRQIDINTPHDGEHIYSSVDGEIICIVRRYIARDAEGQPVLGSDGKPKKEFRQFSQGSPYPKMPDIRPLYNLPGINTADRIIWVEGEKCADDLNKLGYVATCTLGGAGMLSPKSAPSYDFSPLQGKELIIWPDNDASGAKVAKLVQELAARAGARSITMLTPPRGKPEKWDASDAISEGFDIAAFVNAPNKATKKPINLLDNSLLISEQFRGPAPEQHFLIDSTLPLGVPVVFAAAGDSGKGMMTLDLAMKIASGKPMQFAFGGLVSHFGNVVLLCAEDDKDEIHRRIESLDPNGDRFSFEHNLYIIPLPNLGGVFPIMVKVDNSYAMGEEFLRLYEQILQIENLALFVADPLASFVHADVNADPAAGAAFMGMLAQMATETGATVMVNHHMAKIKDSEPITTPEQARNLIRGTSAIVDGVRAAFALWQVEEKTAREFCKFLNIPFSRNICFDGAVVKSNGPANREIRHFVRDMNTGLLKDCSIELLAAQTASGNTDMRRNALIGFIELRENNGEAVMMTGRNGVHEVIQTMSNDHIFINALKPWSKSTIKTELDYLLSTGQVILKALTPSGATKFLGVPGGPLSRGEYQPTTARDNV